MSKRYILKDCIKYIEIKDFFGISCSKDVETILVFEKLQDGTQSRIVRNIIINMHHPCMTRDKVLKDIDFIDVRYELIDYLRDDYEDESSDFKLYYIYLVEVDYKNSMFKINLKEV